MEQLFTIRGYRNYLINYYRYDSDKDRLEQRKERIAKFNDEYLENIIRNTENFSSVLLEHMKRDDQIFDEKIFTSIKLDYMFIDIKNGCSGGFPCDTLIKPLGMEETAIISEHLLKKKFPTLDINIIHDSFEERIDDIVATFPLDELHISCTVKDFNELYEGNSSKETGKQLVK